MIELLGDRLLIEVEKNKNITESGIVLPDIAVSKSLIGTVITVGPGRYTINGDVIPLKVKEGDRILFENFAGSTIILEDKEYLLINEQNVIGIIKK